MDKKQILSSLFAGLNIAGQPEFAVQDALVAAVFSRRMSDPETYRKSLRALVYLHQKDFPAMQDREIVSFYSSPNWLKGYLYRSSLSKGLILFAHGIKGQADDLYAIGENYFITHGYDLLAIDLAASGRSGGTGINGLEQSALDIAAAIEFVKSRDDLKNLPLYLLGHSWGAYGVCASQNKGIKADKIVAISGFNTPLEEMLAMPESKTGFKASDIGGDLEEALKKRSGPNYALSASKGLEVSHVPALIIHGEDDDTVPLKASIYEKSKGLSNVEHLLIPHKGHMDIFFEDASVEYANNVLKLGQERLVDIYGKDLSLAPEQAKEEFLSTFSRQLTSVLNEKLVRVVDEFLSK